ncbi:MAG TPA: IS200/IS605 family transposase [Kofleriaceae bacterium]|nr:IS200/IS605 family transposase [Kofleriaceae bacterium]
MPYCKLYFHFVWATKYRNETITAALRAPLYEAITAKASELKAHVHALNGMSEHVHLVVELPPVSAPSEFIGAVKGFSSHSVNRQTRILMPTTFKWQTEYSVFTFSESELPIIVNYVERQQQHHATGTLRKRFEDW